MIHIYTESEEQKERVRVIGHANGGQGIDPVCAAVSGNILLLQEFLHWMGESDGICEIRSGYAEMVFSDRCKDVVAAFLLTMGELSLRYPSCIRLEAPIKMPERSERSPKATGFGGFEGI